MNPHAAPLRLRRNDRRRSKRTLIACYRPNGFGGLSFNDGTILFLLYLWASRSDKTVFALRRSPSMSGGRSSLGIEGPQFQKHHIMLCFGLWWWSELNADHDSRIGIDDWKGSISDFLEGWNFTVERKLQVSWVWARRPTSKICQEKNKLWRISHLYDRAVSVQDNFSPPSASPYVITHSLNPRGIARKGDARCENTGLLA